MYKPVPLFIALRYGKSKDKFGRFVTWLSAIGLTLGVIALILVLSIMNGFEKGMSNGILSYVPQAQITTSENSFSATKYPKEHFIPYLSSEYTDIQPLVTREGVIQGPNGLSVITLLGIDEEQSDPLLNSLYTQQEHPLKEGQFDVVIGWAMARKLGVELGDQIRLIIPDVPILTPLGRLPNQRLLTISGIYSVNFDTDNSFILLNRHDAAKLLRFPKDNISSWRVYMKNPLDIDHLLAKKLPHNFIMKDWRQQKGDLFNAVSMEKRMMTLLIGLIIIVAAFNIIASLSLLVMEKQGEIAILQTIGLTRKKVVGIFIIKGISIGVVGAVIGTVLGVTLTYHINAILSALGLSILGITLPVEIVPQQIAIIFIFSIVISLLSTLYPAWNAAKQQPAEALRYE